MDEKPWYIWLGNGGRYPYLLGVRRPIAVCTEDAKPFATYAEAEAEIAEYGGKWCERWAPMRPIR